MTNRCYILLCLQAVNCALSFVNSKREELLLVRQNLRHAAEPYVSLASLLSGFLNRASVIGKLRSREVLVTQFLAMYSSRILPRYIRLE